MSKLRYSSITGEMRSITLTGLTRTLLSGDIGADAIDEIEPLLRVLLSEPAARGSPRTFRGPGGCRPLSSRRFSAASRRLRVLLTGIIDGYRRGGADHGDLISILMRARDDDTGAGMTGKQLRDEATTLVIAGSGDDGEHHRLGLLPARPAPGDPGTAPGRSRPRAGRPRCQLPGPGQAALHQRRDHPGAAPGQPGLDTAPPGARRCRARRPPAPGRKQDLRQPGRAQPRRAAAPRPPAASSLAGRPPTTAGAICGQPPSRPATASGTASAKDPPGPHQPLLLSAIAARWQPRLDNGAAVHPAVSSTLIPSELPIIMTHRRSQPVQDRP